MATFCRGEEFLYERRSDVIMPWPDNVQSPAVTNERSPNVKQEEESLIV